ncbi:CDP-diacylglycerol--glycerol-3-phosphate 3-phosphatidyltransferase [Candidatus Saccharibacteria bacterium]|nr:CDP-diacylglycerol--glycerol-3-phosphate 3-phosphatidyltransferase [Candidatus Saccharibacteria bacterium]
MTFPTYLTLLRIVLAIISTVFFMLPYSWAKITALVIFIIASLTDRVDGYLARKYKQVTDLGAFLDPLADKMLINLTFLVFVFQSIVPLWVFAVILVRDFAVDGMRMMAARHKTTIAASFYGKLKTTIQMVALIIIAFANIIQNQPLTIIGDIILYIALALTVFSGLDYLIKGRKLLAK